MNFLHPSFLWGLGALAVPLVLHFLLRRRVRLVQFSSLALLRLLQQRQSRYMRLAQLLLLLVRLAIVATLVVLFAQPFFSSGTLAGLNAGPETVVVFVDDSRSTALAVGAGGTVHDRIRAAVTTAVTGLDPRTTAIVVSLSPRARVVYRGDAAHFSGDALPPPGPVRPDVAGAVGRLDTFFEETPTGRRRLLVVSDFQAFPWATTLDELAKLSCSVELVRVEVDPHVDWAIAGVGTTVQNAVIGEPCPFVVELLYASVGKAPTPTRLVASVDGRVAAAVAVVPNAGTGGAPAPSGRVRLEVPVTLADEGIRVVTFRLDDDDLLDDNETTVAVQTVRERLVILFNGDPRPSPTNDEVFFLRRVYERAAERRFRIRDVVGDDRPTAGELQQAAVVHLAAWAPGDDGLAAELREYVRRGGTLVVWAGDALQTTAASSRLLVPLAGLRLRGVADHGGSWQTVPDADTPLGHLVAPAYVASVSSRRAFFVETTDEADGRTGPQPERTAVRLGDGAPVLVVQPVGDGHFCFFNTSADLDWSDFPLQPVYPVVVSQLPHLTRSPIARLAPGDRYAVDVDLAGRGDATAEVRTPDGRKVVVQPVFSGERFCFAFDGTQWPGVYRMIRTVGDERTEDVFDVQPDKAELDLTTMAPSSVVVPGGAERAGAFDGRRLPVKMSDLLFILVLMLFVAEGVVVTTIERASHGEDDGV